MKTKTKLMREYVLARVIVDDKTGCWNWCLYTDKDGYGRSPARKFGISLAHRLSYRAWNGLLDGLLTIDHLCRNRACVNPSHLEQVSKKENTMRGTGVPSINAKKTHCIRGHPLGEARKHKRGFRRMCTICGAAAARKYRLGKTQSIPETTNDTMDT